MTIDELQNLMQDTFDEIRPIGSGGIGEIFRAHHKRLDKDVVLKKIHIGLVSKVETRAELNVLKNLKHPYIPQVFDFVEYDNNVFTVMEYISGKSFDKLLKTQRFTKKEVTKWARQLCDVVAYLHGQTPPIIHCDIKPANIMLTDSGDICLIDFNISATKHEESIVAIGYSDVYAPIEQMAVVARQRKKGKEESLATSLREAQSSDVDDKTVLIGEEESCTNADESIGQYLPKLNERERKEFEKASLFLGDHPRVDERTDIYSIGATLYHLYTGKKPQSPYKPYIPIEKMRPDIGDSIAFIINKAMEKNADDRFQTGSHMRDAFFNLNIYDKRYKRTYAQECVLLLTTFIICVISAFLIRHGLVMNETKRADSYMACVSDMMSAGDAGDYEAAQLYFQKARDLFPKRQDAYYELANVYYEKREYAKCMSFLDNLVYNNSDLSETSDYGYFYYLSAGSALETGDYETAKEYYKKAIHLQPDILAYYRDLAIALARNGDIDKAEETVNTAKEKGISSETLELLEGEVALIQKNYEKAKRCFENCIASGTEEYNILRAYTKLDETYTVLYAGHELADIRIRTLEEAIERLPAKQSIVLQERLAHVYIEQADATGDKTFDEKALTIFIKMENAGLATYTTLYNTAVMYEKLEQYEQAEALLQEMIAEYPGHYASYKRMAFLQLEMQNLKEKDARDYAKFAEYYADAVRMYGDNTGAEDMEMKVLEKMYGELQANGWL